MRTNTRKFSLMLTALVLVLTLSLAMAVPVLAECHCDDPDYPYWTFFHKPALRAEITSPQEGECIAVGSTFTVEVTVYNESDNCACGCVDINCVLNGGWPAGQYPGQNLAFAAGETQHKSTSGAWPGDPIAANSSMVFTWEVLCTGPGESKIRINPSARSYSAGEAGADTVTFHQAYPAVPLEVSIDIKPGSDPNSINLKSRGVLPVAVLTTDDFDASTTDPDTVGFAGVPPLRWALEDVDNDGDMDMLFHFKTQGLVLDTNSTQATLTGATCGGWFIITGTDTVNIVGK